MIWILALLSALLQAAAAGPVALTSAEATAITRQIKEQRTEAERALRSSPTSYLATVARRDFGDRTRLTVGRASDNDVVLDDPAVLAHHLEVNVDGDRFVVRAVDADGRTIQMMRSFVQVAPGTTRSCICCHEQKYSTAARSGSIPELLGREPSRLQPEWTGSSISAAAPAA